MKEGTDRKRWASYEELGEEGEYTGTSMGEGRSLGGWCSENVCNMQFVYTWGIVDIHSIVLHAYVANALSKTVSIICFV